MNIQYTCKFCHNPGIVTLDDEPNEMFDRLFPTFQQMLCCNRCGKFYERKRSLSQAVFRVARNWQAASMAQRSAIEQSIREQLAILTKQIAKLACDFYHKQTVWEPDFINMILDKPEGCGKIIGLYIRGVSTVR